MKSLMKWSIEEKRIFALFELLFINIEKLLAHLYANSELFKEVLVVECFYFCWLTEFKQRLLWQGLTFNLRLKQFIL